MLGIADRSGSRERLVSPIKDSIKDSRKDARNTAAAAKDKLPNGRLMQEMEPLTEAASEPTADLAADLAADLPFGDEPTPSGVESWLENSSKYHSCELVDE